jgi:hypothetical protein
MLINSNFPNHFSYFDDMVPFSYDRRVYVF